MFKMKPLCHLSEKVSFKPKNAQFKCFPDNNLPEKEVHSPVAGVEMYDGVGVYDPEIFELQKHAVVLKDHKLLGF